MTSETEENAPGKKDERLAFATLAIFLAPILVIVFVGGLGFTIWMSNLVFGPPAG